MQALVLKPLETMINQYINLDPQSKQRLAKLNGKTLKLIASPITLYFVFEADAIKLAESAEEASIDATLEGSPLSFIQMHFTDKANVPSFFKQNLSISGDLDFGQDVRALFKDLDIDWEEHLSKLTGDIVAHEVSNFVKHASDFALKTSTSFQQTLTEYLQQEARHLPCREEVEDFFDDIDALKLRVDRLQAKFKQQ